MVRTEPEAFSVLEDLDREVRFYFDERISERVAGGTLEEAVSVSPNTGALQVGHSRSSVTVRVEGGFRPGLVYRVTLEPVVSDLFGNPLRDPFELVFSTGGDPSPTTLAGQVWDRTTGEGVTGVRVQAVDGDSLMHVARTGADGIYAFRYLPGGAFSVTGFEDLNRDGEPGDSEIQGDTAASVAAGDTLLLDFPVLLPDTTPAATASASALDSVTVLVEFDDFLEPTSSSDQITVRLTREEEAGPVVVRVYHEHEYRDFVDRVADSLSRLDSLDAAAAAAAAADAPADSTAPDTVAPDSVPAAPPPDPDVDPAPVDPATDPDASAVPDTLRVGAGRGAGPGPGGADAPPTRRGPPSLPGGGRGSADLPPGRLLPGRLIVGQLSGPLEAEAEYLLRVTDVVNINGLAGGGGDVTLVRELAPPDTVPVDPGTESPDSSAVVPDTATRPDTLPGR